MRLNVAMPREELRKVLERIRDAVKALPMALKADCLTDVPKEAAGNDDQRCATDETER